jgi:UDP-N-acetylglucosamine 2-epimerase
MKILTIIGARPYFIKVANFFIDLFNKWSSNKK